MALRLDTNRKPGEAMRTLLESLAADARSNLLRMELDPPKNIHDLRTNAKKLRSLLRLVRKDLPAQYRRAVDLINSIKNRFATARDAAVAGQTAERVLGRALAGHSTNGAADAAVDHAAVEEMLRTADELIELIRSLPLDDVSKSELRHAYEKTRRRARKAMKRAESTGAPEHLHEWRKRTKDAWYQAAALRDLDSSIARDRGRAKALSDLLGLDHDLHVLESTAHDLSKADRACIDHERTPMRRRIFKRGEKLFD